MISLRHVANPKAIQQYFAVVGEKKKKKVQHINTDCAHISTHEINPLV